MSTPVHSDETNDQPTAAPPMCAPTMYAPPWAREQTAREQGAPKPTQDLFDAPSAAAENVLAAARQFSRVLPPAPQIAERRARRRDPAPFEGDLAAMLLRERPTLDPVTMPPPPLRERGSSARVLARVAGAVGLAALAAFFMVGTTPLSFAVKAESDAAPSLWTRFVARAAPQPAQPARPPEMAPAALEERFSAMPQPQPEARPAAVAMVPAAVQPPPAATPRPRMLDREEIAILYRRSEELIGQGDIAGGRLLLMRAAESGDARSALALGATFDAAVLGRLGVLGVAPDAERARAWYAKAAAFGSSEATRRLEHFAQSER